ncbi:MAG: zinc ribbon domain-containing protein [Lachnospiraceae bacterium]|nr:zinc ribbon domain-containing protein [Lachnospiraceae bacterium]
MICDKCGSQIPNGSIFCTSCGKKLKPVEKAEKLSQDEAKNELARANEAAADVVASANAEAAKVAEEYSQAIKNVSTDFHETVAKAGNSVAEITGVEAQTDTVALPVPSEEVIPEEKENTLPAPLENVPAVTEGETGDAVPENTEDNTQLPVENKNAPAERPVPSQAVANEKRQSPEIKAGKSIPAGMIILGTLGLIVVIVACIFIFSGSARNGIKKLFLSDENYFRSVEKNAVLDIVDDLSVAYDDDFLGALDFMKSEYALNIDVDVKDEAEDFLEALYKKNRDVDLSWIKTANAEMNLKMKDKMFQAKGEISVNKKDLGSFDYIGNLNENKYYFGIPILSKEYASVDKSMEIDLDAISSNIGTFNLKTLVDSTAFQDALPSKKELNRIVEKYLDIALEKITRIKFYEDQVLEAGKVKNRYLMISAALDEDLQPEIYDAILKELSKDDEVLAIINRIEKTGVFGDSITADKFLDWIEETQDNLYNRPYTFMTLNIWVDDTGKVVGQQIVDDNGTGYTYKYVINEGNFGFEAFYAKKNKVRDNVVASGTISGSSVTGNFAYYTNSGKEALSLDFSDVDVIDLLRGNPNGTLLLDIYDMTGDKQFKGLKLTVEFDITLKKSTANFKLSDAGKTIIEADATLKKSSAGTVKEPGKIIEVDKNNNLAAWYNNFDWSTVLKNADKANMPSRYYRQLEKWSESGFDSFYSGMSGLLPSFIFGERAYSSIYDDFDD